MEIYTLQSMYVGTGTSVKAGVEFANQGGGWCSRIRLSGTIRASPMALVQPLECHSRDLGRRGVWRVTQRSGKDYVGVVGSGSLS